MPGGCPCRSYTPKTGPRWWKRADFSHSTRCAPFANGKCTGLHRALCANWASFGNQNHLRKDAGLGLGAGGGGAGAGGWPLGGRAGAQQSQDGGTPVPVPWEGLQDEWDVPRTRRPHWRSQCGRRTGHFGRGTGLHWTAAVHGPRHLRPMNVGVSQGTWGRQRMSGGAVRARGGGGGRLAPATAASVGGGGVVQAQPIGIHANARGCLGPPGPRGCPQWVGADTTPSCAGWWRLATVGEWRLVAVGGQRLVVPGGCP